MGTKADFYIKSDEVLKWVGSVEWECDEAHIPEYVVQSCCDDEFLLNLETYFNSKKQDVILPHNGWSWHWPSSKQTDYAYIMVQERGTVYISKHNSPCYTIYDYRNYKARSKKARKEGKDIEDFYSFIEKVSPFTPSFPRMVDEQSKEDRLRNTPCQDGSSN